MNSGVTSSAATGIQIAFAPRVSLDCWSQYLAEDDAQIVEVVLQTTNFENQKAKLQVCIAAGDLLPILIERERQLQILIAEQSWQVGDRITYLLYSSSPQKLPATVN